MRQPCEDKIMNCLPPVLLPQRGVGAAVGGAPGRSGAEQSPLAAGSLPTSETSDVRLLSRSSRAEQNLQLRFVPQRWRASQTFSSANSSSSLQKKKPYQVLDFAAGFPRPVLLHEGFPSASFASFLTLCCQQPLSASSISQ